MIYGVIPVGGKGTRLGLSFSKEMLPRAGVDFYAPVIDHTVSKMKEAEVDKIVFIHGEKFKEDIVTHYNHGSFFHMNQTEPSFAGCLKDAYVRLSLQPNDKVLFGLPDSLYEDNLFPELLKLDGIACGLFITKNNVRVDRISSHINCGHEYFVVKSERKEGVGTFFWGVLKFDGENIGRMVKDGMFDKYKEIGHILNRYDKKMVYGKQYVDLGTWENLNEYWRRGGQI